MNYLITTNKGNIYSIQDGKSQPILKDDSISIYTGDQSFRFIKKYNEGYLVGKSESIMIWAKNGINLTLPGLVDIQDIAIGENFIAILSGARDSIYILNKELNQILVCFNIGKSGNLEFFKERQVQCQEIPSNYFQIFYCPALNNFHNFNRLALRNEGVLSIISDNNMELFDVHLSEFSIYKHDYIPGIYQKIDKDWSNVKDLGEFEIITDYIEV